MHAVFDLDGTLVDSAGVFAQVLNAMLVERGSARRVTADDARKRVSLGGQGMVATLLGAECGDPKDEVAAFRARYAALPTPSDSLYDGVREGLAELAAHGVKLAICSNKPQPLCEKVIADLGLADRFEAVVGSAPGEPAKPDPAPLDKALRLSGGLRSACCVIGDEHADHALALNAGVPFVHAAYGYGPEGRRFDGALHAEVFAHVPGLVVRALPALR